MNQLWALVCDTFRYTRDRKLFWVMLVISTLTAGGLACVGFDENGWSFMFGAITKPDPTYVEGSPAAARIMARLVADFLIGNYLAWIGIIAFLLTTGGVFPYFMERGAVEVVVAKPISRVTIFLGKYLGSLAFVTVQATYFCLLSLVVLRLQIDRWLWGYLWSIPLVVALFSFLYCVCVLLAVFTRSTLASVTLTILFWISIAGVTVMDRQLSGQINLLGDQVQPRTWSQMSTTGKAVRAVHMAMPKTGDIPDLVARYMGASTHSELMTLFTENGDPAAVGRAREQMQRIDDRAQRLSAWRVLGSSFAFEIVVLIIACWRFVRLDF